MGGLQGVGNQEVWWCQSVKESNDSLPDIDIAEEVNRLMGMEAKQNPRARRSKCLERVNIDRDWE
jgi:hypothetical protein